MIRVTMVITPIGGLIIPFITIHEPPSMGLVDLRAVMALLGLGISHIAVLTTRIVFLPG